MTHRVDLYGRPKDLESPEQLKFRPYRVDSGYISPRYRLGADRTANTDEAMMFIDLLLKKYETTYKTHEIDQGLLYLPYLFSKPANGSEIKNKKTGEIYSIRESIVNPTSGKWEGLVRINYIDPPKLDQGHKIEFINDHAHVRFTESYGQLLGNENQTSNGLIKDSGPIQPTIVYFLARKEPGSMEKPFGATKEYKKRLREKIADPDSPSHTIEIYGRLFDNLVQFDCCTTDNASANRLANWFETFMELYEWVLKLNGVQQILFWQRSTDTAEKNLRQDLTVRSIQYYFRTEEVEAITRRDITSIDIAVNAVRQIEDTSTRYVAGHAISGQISEQDYFSLFRDSNGKYLFGKLYYNDGNL